MSAPLGELFGVEGRVALVTGAGSGIARAAAVLLARLGANVAVVDINAQAAEATVAEIRELGREAIAIPRDLTDVRAPKEMVKSTEHTLGTPSIAINVCGGTGGVYKSFLDISPEEWQKPLDLNLRSTFLSNQAEAVAMVRAGISGAIVNVGSTSGVTAAPTLAGYGAANAGVIHFTKTAAVELAPFAIRVNCVIPGTHWTAGTRSRYNDHPESREFFDLAEATTPMRRLGEAEDTARVAVFLGTQLSPYVTGHSVISDGGILHTTARPAAGGQAVPAAIQDYVVR